MAAKGKKCFLALNKHDVNRVWGREHFGAESTYGALWLELEVRVTQDKGRFPLPFTAGGCIFSIGHYL